MKGIKDNVSAPLEQSLFEVAAYDSAAAERAGYSNYSYWGSTLRCFMKNRVAVTLLCVLFVLVLFTCIQPLLPGQFEANKVIDHPIAEMQMSNVQPALTNVMATVPAGTQLVVTPFQNAEYAAVSNILLSMPARTEFTVLEYGDAWCKAQVGDLIGYVKNDFTTKLKLPEDVAATPYTSRSNFPLKLYTSEYELTYHGNELFVLKSAIDIDGDIAVTTKEAQLRLLPDTRPFLFGTNNTGQD